MKFGILRNTERNNINIGDHIMGIAIERIYDEMGIDKSQRVDVLLSDIGKYDGEYIILPINMYVDSINMLAKDSEKLFSHRIIPVFFGTHMLSETGTLRYIKQYAHFGPFGCRDEFTMNALRKNGLDAYISGCLSILAVDRRENNKEYDKIYFVDVPEKIFDYVPKEIIDSGMIEKLSHVFDYTDKGLDFKTAQEIGTKLARERYELYRNTARLVVTSRLHCALPCVSMGIPVIVVRTDIPQRYKSAFDGRFAGVDKFLNMYSYDEFDNINWYPNPVDIEPIKKMQMELAKNMIMQAYNKYSKLCDVSYYYENRKKNIYFSGISNGYLSLKQKEDFLNGKTINKNLLSLILGDNLGKLHIIIYGAGDKGRWMWERYKDDLVMCKSVIYVDGNKEKYGTKLNGKAVLAPSVLDKYNLKNTRIIIATNTSYDESAQSIAKFLHDKYNLEDGRDYFMLDRLNLSAKYAMSDFGEVNDCAQDAIWY